MYRFHPYFRSLIADTCLTLLIRTTYRYPRLPQTYCQVRSSAKKDKATKKKTATPAAAPHWPLETNLVYTRTPKYVEDVQLKQQNPIVRKLLQIAIVEAHRERFHNSGYALLPEKLELYRRALINSLGSSSRPPRVSGPHQN